MCLKTLVAFVFSFLFCLVAQAEEVNIAHRNLSLVGNLRMPEGASLGDGPVVLMTHGTLAHGGMEIMQALQDGLAAQGVNSLAITLSLGLDRRHGMYECSTQHTHRHTDAMAEIGAWLAWLKAQGAKDVVLLGHSRGGNQTAWFAAERDDPSVSKVVLVAPMTWSHEAMHADYRKSYGRNLKPLQDKARQMVAAKKGYTLMKGVDFIYCPKTKVTASAFASYYAEEPRMDTPGLVGKINEKVLVVAGSEDSVVTGLPERMQASVAEGKAGMVVIDGADHFFRDLYADEAVEAIVAFIRQ